MKSLLSIVGFFLVVCCLLVPAGRAAGENTVDLKKAEEARAVYVISVKNAPNDAKAFGFDVLYPKDTLKFETLQKGALIKDGFSFFMFNEVSPGRVRMGGFAPDDNYMKKGASGELIVVIFKKIGTGSRPAELKIVDIKDHMKLWGSYSSLSISEKE